MDIFLEVVIPCKLLKKYEVVHTSLLHRVHMVSVVILHLRLVVDGSVSYAEARQKEVRLAGIAIKEA